jgi:tetratricopeptide (TPR) repeat protein/DNA-binding CsgD family transcriptional regulator
LKIVNSSAESGIKNHVSAPEFCIFGIKTDFDYFCKVKKSRLHIIILLWLSVFATSCVKLDIQEDYNVSPELATIDTLMWHQPDSALAVMMEFAASPKADSLDVFEGHYCQVLIAELLFKNYYKQSNRKDLLKAVRYFDSIVGMDGYGTDTRGVSVQEREAFLAARAHYINGVGFYERDSVVAACGEYLKALEIVETHFPNLETQDVAALQVEHLPRFMGLTYGRLAELFSGQFMQEPAIVCCKKALAYDRIEISSPLNQSSLLILLGKQYAKLNQNDSASYYCNEALQMLPDTNNAVYRDLVSQLALINYDLSKDAEASIIQLKRMLAQTSDENEKMARISTIGSIYCDDGQYDSALVYLVPMFENKDNAVRQRVAASYLHEIYQSKGDTVKAAQFAVYLAENTVSQGESNAQVSQLNELFQQHLQWEQEKAEAERRQTEQLAARRRLVQGVVTAVVVLLVLGLGLWWWMAKRRKEHDAETQTLNEEKQQLQTQVDDALQQLQTVDDALQQLQTQADDALQQARAMLPQRVADLYRAKVPNRLERIMDEFEAAYPGAMERVAVAYPNLTKTETQLFVLSFLQFRAKEEADLLGLSQNTVLQYRSNLRKKTENASISSFLEA